MTMGYVSTASPLFVGELAPADHSHSRSSGQPQANRLEESVASRTGERTSFAFLDHP